MTAETWLILGASSAIARAFAREAAAKGCDVLLAGRDLDDLGHSAADLRIRYGGHALAMAFDATAYGDHDAFVTRCREATPGTLSVFLAFGLMPDQADVDGDFLLARKTIETTYLGAVSILSRLAPLLERQGAGRVVVLGSVAGDRGRLKNYLYGSAKAGLHHYMQGLRARLARSGVSVTVVKPGFVDTAMTWGLPGLFLVASPQDCARACLRFAERGADVRYVPWFWQAIMAVIKAIPEPLFKRLKI